MIKIAILSVFMLTFQVYHTFVEHSNVGVMYTNNDQIRCQQEANYMATNNIMAHIWGTIGDFEGIGYGDNPNCNTCIPNNTTMRLTGDASVMGKNGMWYRVRSWRK